MVYKCTAFSRNEQGGRKREGKARREEIPAGTQISGRKHGLKACPIFKGQLEVIIIRLCNFFPVPSFLSFSLTSNPIQICSHGLQLAVKGYCVGQELRKDHLPLALEMTTNATHFP